MKEIEAVNLILRQSGNDRVHQLGTADPRAEGAVATLTRVRRELLAERFPFNATTIDLAVNSEGRVPLAKTYLWVKFPKLIMGVKEHEETGTLCVWNTDENEWWDDEIEKVVVCYDIENFENIPHPFCGWIAWRAACEFQAEYEGSPRPYSHAMALRMETKARQSLPPVNILNAVTGYGITLATYYSVRM